MTWTFDGDNYGNPLMEQFGHDFCGALHHNSVSLPAEPDSILATIEGSHDGPNWHWIVLLKDSTWAYITGGCDYTGWDCQSHCYAYPGLFLEEVLAQANEPDREVLIEMINKGEVSRKAGSW